MDTEEAVRLTVCGGVSAPLLSYDGSRVAFTSYCSGESEVYTISTAGGPMQQITYTGQCATRVVSWDQENEDVIYVTRSLVTTTRPDGQEVCALNLHTGAITSLNYGEAAHYQKGKSWALIGRHTRDNHVREWKHYKGGNIGQLWVENGDVADNRFRQNMRKL